MRSRLADPASGSRPVLALVILAALMATPSARSQAGSAGDVFSRDDIFNRKPLEYFRHVVRSLAWYRGALWVGTYGSGIHVLEPDGTVRSVTSRTSPLLEDRVNCLAVRGEELWIGTCAGINVFDGESWRSYTTADGVAHDIYHAIRIAPDGKVWVGTTGHGISVFDGQTWTTIDSSSGLKEDWIDDILIEPGGRVWATTFHTVARFDGDSIRTLSPVGDEMPYPILSLGYRDGEVWLGTVARGVHFWQDGYWFHPRSPALDAENNKVRAFVTDAEQRLWMGTDLGIVRYTPDGGFRHYGVDEGLAEAYTKSLYLDDVGRLWAGSWIRGVVSLYRPDVDRFEAILEAGKYTGKRIGSTPPR